MTHQPTDIPEMKMTATFILQKIKEKDPDQYSVLLQSIGVEEDSPVETAISNQEVQ